MGDNLFKDDITRREAMKTALKAGAYAAPVVLAASVPGAVMAATPAPGPAITGIAPATGPTTGGTIFVLTGTNFCAGATVTIGGVAATGVTVVSSTTITGTAPAGALGTVNVVVTCPNGQTATLPNGFTYTAVGAGPTIGTVVPNGGPTAGGTPVTITGTGFVAGATVFFGGVPATGVTVVNGTTITATTPPGAQGPVTVGVTDPNGQSATLPNGYTYHTITATGEAYTANASVLGVLNVSRVGDVTLPPGGSNSAVAVSLAPTLVLTGGANSAQNISTPGNVTARSNATVATTSLLAGALTATALSATSTSTSNGIAASSTAAFSGIVTVGANSYNLATVGANFTVPVAIPGVASVVLNRVVTTTVGANSSQTATAVFVSLTGLPPLIGATTVEIATAISGVTST